jgi:murein DD-endopeptidase MepM/ murein hydrolase activator NlpD
MQMTWVSGPTGKVRTISITAKKAAIAAGLASLGLLAAGFLLYVVGFKFAIEFRPELARSMGGVTTEAEQQRVESVYRERLGKLQGALESATQEIRQLQQLKNRFMELATPASLRPRSEQRGDMRIDGRGGPLIPGLRTGGSTSLPLAQSLDRAIDDFSALSKIASGMREDWDSQLAWLHALPTGLPVDGEFQVTSGWGLRMDPFTGQLARHEGLDFTASDGTPIVAAADGIVTRSGWESTYGNIVEITHAEGFMTRYAHLSQRRVNEGQQIKRGQHIADVGSTGRSTGPHLHYEVFRHGRVMNPVQVLSLSRS